MAKDDYLCNHSLLYSLFVTFLDVERKRHYLQILRLVFFIYFYFLILINIQERQMAFLHFSNLIEQHNDELAALETWDV